MGGAVIALIILFAILYYGLKENFDSKKEYEALNTDEKMLRELQSLKKELFEMKKQQKKIKFFWFF